MDNQIGHWQLKAANGGHHLLELSANEISVSVHAMVSAWSVYEYEQTL